MKHRTIPMHENMRAVDGDQWADALTDIPGVYQTEESFEDGGSVMYSKTRDGYVVGEVHYLPGAHRIYYVRPAPGAKS